MATSGRFTKKFANNKCEIGINWEITEQYSSSYVTEITWSADITNNTSSKITIKKGNISYKPFDSDSYKVLNSSMSRSFLSRETTPIYRNGLTDTTEWTDKVTHDIYGKATASIELICYIDAYLDGVYCDSVSVGGSIELSPFDKIIDAGLSTDKAAFGEKIDIRIPYQPKCTYVLEAHMGEIVERIDSNTTSLVTKTVKWTVSESLADAIPSATVGFATIVCSTYDTDTMEFIGSRTYPITLYVPDSAVPVIKVDIEADGTTLDYKTALGSTAYADFYLAGFTRLHILSDCEGKLGATIKSISVTVYGHTYSGENVTTDIIPRTASGSIPITIKATDSRGWVSTVTKYVTITSYTVPKIESFSIHRCLENGTLDDEGNNCFVELQGSVKSLLAGNRECNAIIATVSIKESGSSDPEEEYYFDCPSGTSFKGSLIIPELEEDACYDITVTLSDKVTSVDETSYLSTAFTILDIYSDGTGMAFGKVAQYPNLIEFDIPVRMNKNFTCSEEWINENTLAMINAYFGYEGHKDILGLQVDYENKRFTRLAGAADLNAGNDFNALAPYSGMKRCNVSDDGSITAYFGDKNFKDDGSNGQVMVCVPKFYYRVVPLKLEKNLGSGIGYHIRKANYYISSEPKAGFKLHPAFYDENGNEIDYFLYSAYESSLLTADGEYFHDGTMTDTSLDMSKDRLCSVAGKKPISGKYKKLTISNEEIIAKNRGKGWHIDTVKSVSAIQLLMIIEYGLMNMQNAIGRGIVDVAGNGTYNCTSITGSTASLGNDTGSALSTDSESAGKITTYSVNGKVAVSYRGIENFWGNIWKHINGINIWGDGTMAGGQIYIADDFNFADSKLDGNYRSAGFTLPTETDYINAVGYGNEAYDWLIIGSEAGGTSELPVGDKTYVTSNLDGYQSAYLGGNLASGTGAGPFYWNAVNVGGRAYNQAARLIFVPTKA